MKPFTTFVLACLLLLPSSGQQPNSASASMTLGGVDGPPWPIVLPINVATWNPSFAIEISGPPLHPFILAAAPAGVTSPGLPTPFGLVDLDLSGGLIVLFDGTGPITPSSLLAYTGPTGSWSLTVPLVPGTTGISAGLQCLMVTPGGLVLTAATHLTTVNVPTSAFFVSHSHGAPGNPGTAGSPFLTIAEGVNAAFAAGAPYPAVKVEQGMFSVPGGMNFQPGVSVTGGLDAISWVPVAGAHTTIDVGVGSITIQNVATPTTIERLKIVAAAGAPASYPASYSSIALKAFFCDASLGFVNCQFEAHDGQAGANGSSPPAAANGISGSPGSTSGPGGAGGQGSFNGGYGGVGGLPPGTPGTPGFIGLGPGGGLGGPGTLQGCPSTSDAADGLSGATGANGDAGTHVHSPGGIVTAGGDWGLYTGTSGTSGESGSGGGGGGGSGALILGFSCPLPTSGNGGGGGGAGGEGGLFGTYGQSGGASFGVLVHGATPNFQDCTFTTGNGGTGGNGGAGAAGGSGGSGGNGGSSPTPTGSGGNGGAGGGGGHGGGGAGGHGGFSFGVYKSGTSVPTFTGSNTFNIGSAGAGGAGGAAPGGNPGQNGSPGLAGNLN